MESSTAAVWSGGLLSMSLSKRRGLNPSTLKT